VDNRWILKISCITLPFFREEEIDPNRMDEEESLKQTVEKLWVAPELLRMGKEKPIYGTQKGDVYSFAIVVQEIAYRASAFFIEDWQPHPRGRTMLYFHL